MNSKLKSTIAVFSSVTLLALVWFNTQEQDLSNTVINTKSVNVLTTEVSKVEKLATKPEMKASITQVEVNEFEEGENPFFEQETKARLIQIADSFAEDIQYPDYSKPIRGHDELRKYLPNQSVASALPLDTKDEHSPKIVIKTSKLQYFSGETIWAEAYVSGGAELTSTRVFARLVHKASTLIEVEGEPDSQQESRFLIAFDSQDISGNQSGDYRIVAQFHLDDRRYEIGTPIQYVNAVASIDEVGQTKVEGSELQIPLNITSYELGFYQASANLYNADNSLPLLHLSAEKEILKPEATIYLRAHIAALKAAGHEGPYLLKDLTLKRMPSRPDFTTKFGRSSIESAELAAHSFGEYLDAPYDDPKARERLEFLTQLGGGN